MEPSLDGTAWKHKMAKLGLVMTYCHLFLCILWRTSTRLGDPRTYDKKTNQKSKSGSHVRLCPFPIWHISLCTSEVYSTGPTLWPRAANSSTLFYTSRTSDWLQGQLKNCCMSSKKYPVRDIWSTQLTINFKLTHQVLIKKWPCCHKNRVVNNQSVETSMREFRLKDPSGQPSRQHGQCSRYPHRPRCTS